MHLSIITQKADNHGIKTCQGGLFVDFGVENFAPPRSRRFLCFFVPKTALLGKRKTSVIV